jgi:hypothetical protein
VVCEVLARELSKTDPLSFNLLGCRGVVKNHRPIFTEGGEGTPVLTFDFIFAIPQFLSESRSLRELVLLRDKHPFLDEVELTKQLANSVTFVHKNIHPETILIFEQEDLWTDAAFLVGFETLRMSGGRTYGHWDSSREKNIYRHPHQQGFSSQEYYLTQVDIYTLGVCLLEIRLWQSFVICDKERRNSSVRQRD